MKQEKKLCHEQEEEQQEQFAQTGPTQYPRAEIANNNENANTYKTRSSSKTEGKGLKKKKEVKIGGGYNNNAAPKQEQVDDKKRTINAKFIINMQKLKNENILALKYTKNNANLPHFKTISVNDDVKSIIIDLLDTNHVNE